MWIKDHVDAYDVAPCPYCGYQEELGFDKVKQCSNCGVQLTEEEERDQITRLSLEWLKGPPKRFPEDIIVSDDEAYRLLGEKEYEARKLRNIKAGIG